MSSALYQSIEALSREKSIDPGIVVSAVEEAIALATRKYYKTQENMRGELNKETGEITVYAFKTVMGDEDEIEDPVNQITLEEAQAMAEGAELEPGSEIRLYKDTRPLGRIAAQLAKQVIFQKVSATQSSTSTPIAKRKCFPPPSSASRARTSSSTWARQKPACPSASSRVWNSSA
jgi:N utilization substance protein A